MRLAGTKGFAVSAVSPKCVSETVLVPRARKAWIRDSPNIETEAFIVIQMNIKQGWSNLDARGVNSEVNYMVKIRMNK